MGQGAGRICAFARSGSGGFRAQKINWFYRSLYTGDGDVMQPYKHTAAARLKSDSLRSVALSDGGNISGEKKEVHS